MRRLVNKLKLKCLMAATLLLLGGCNTLTREDCEATNWGGVGYNAAFNGKKATQALEKQHRQCDADYGVRPDFKAIEIGYKDGLENFCNRNRGRSFGAGGGSYRDTCPATKEADFLSGYQLGRIEYTGNRMHALEEEVEDLRSEVRRRDNRINDLESEVQSLRK